MTRGTAVVGLAVLAAVAAVAGYQLHRHLEQPPPTQVAGPPPPPAAGGARPAFTLPDLAGTARSASEWDGRVVLVNFWATWCAPCLEEIPALIELQRRHGEAGLRVVGIALDKREAVARFAAEHGINYPVLVGEADGAELSREFGNDIGALPYTAVVDREGRIAFRHRGAISAEEAEAVIGELL